MAIHNILKNLIACINRILGNNTEPPHITQIISTFDTMFDSELHDATPTLQEAKTILKKAFDEGDRISLRWSAWIKVNGKSAA